VEQEAAPGRYGAAVPSSEPERSDELTEAVAPRDAGATGDPATPTSRSRSLGAHARHVATHPATYALLPLVVIAVVVVVRAGHFIPRFDYAFQELAVQEAARAQRLLGPYSRFGFNQPGPLLFYANVPAYALLGKNAGLSMILTRFAVDGACIAVILVLVDRIGRRTAAWGAAVGLVVFELRAGLEWFRDPWNPYVVVLPIVVALVVGASLVDSPPGRRWRSIVLVVAGSFAVQSHIAAVPLVGLALLLGTVGFVRSASNARTHRAALTDAAIALGAGLVCWSLPIWDQLAERGNLHRVASFVGSGADAPSLETVLHPVVLAVTLGAGHLGNVFGPQPFADVPRPGPVAWIVLAAVLAAAVAYAVWSWRRRQFAMATLAAAAPVAAIVELVATLRIKGGVEPYLFAAGLSVGALVWLVVGAGVGDVLERLLTPQRARTILAIAVLVVGASALAVSGRAFDPPAESFGSESAAGLQHGIDEICASGRPVRVVSESAVWFRIGEVGAALSECAPDVRFERALTLQVGARATEPSSADDLLTVRLESPGVALEPGWRRVARTNDATLDVATR
jgi:hypothetical protein